MSDKTVIIGASTNSERYAYKAAHMLKKYNKVFVPVGIKKGVLAEEDILNLREKPSIDGVDTVTLYIGPENQEEWYDYIIDLSPRRIIFNPGTENEILAEKAKKNGIEPVYACTLVMLSTGQY